jgi:hypothetical protein
MIQICTFKKKGRKETKENPNLMANGRFQAWWPLKWIGCLEVNGEASCLVALEMNRMFESQWVNNLFGGQWKVPSLVALWMFHVWLPLEGKGKTSFSLPSIFHPTRFYLNIFSIDFKVLFYHGSRPLLHIFPSFSLAYKL